MLLPIPKWANYIHLDYNGRLWLLRYKSEYLNPGWHSEGQPVTKDYILVGKLAKPPKLHERELSPGEFKGKTRFLDGGITVGQVLSNSWEMLTEDNNSYAEYVLEIAIAGEEGDENSNSILG